MATYTTAEPSIGELRFIARLKSSALPLEYPFGVVSTTMLSPLCEAPKAASAEGESVAAANSALLNNMARDEGFETIDQQNGQ